MSQFVKVSVFRIAVLVLLALKLTAGIDVRSCSNGVPPPAIVSITGCSEMPCDFVRGTNSTTMTMVYEAPFDVQTLRYDRIFTSLGITGPHPVPPARENTCDFLIGSACPFRQGELIISTYTSSPLPIFPLVTASYEFMVYDEQDRMVTCFIYDVRLLANSM